MEKLRAKRVESLVQISISGELPELRSNELGSLGGAGSGDLALSRLSHAPPPFDSHILLRVEMQGTLVISPLPATFSLVEDLSAGETGRHCPGRAEAQQVLCG